MFVFIDFFSIYQLKIINLRDKPLNLFISSQLHLTYIWTFHLRLDSRGEGQRKERKGFDRLSVDWKIKMRGKI